MTRVSLPDFPVWGQQRRRVWFPVLDFAIRRLLATALCLSLFGVSCAEGASTQVVVLKYAVKPTAQTWSLKAVDSIGDVGRYTSIAVDVQGQAHISYCDVTNSDLKYALVAAPERASGRPGQPSR